MSKLPASHLGGGARPRPAVARLIRPKNQPARTLGRGLAPPLLGLLLAAATAQAQVYPHRAPDLDRLTQELFAEIQTDEVPYEDLYGTLLNYYQSPLNLNTATAEELRALPLLRERQVQALLRYRQANGLLLSLYELQAVPEWDVRTIQRVAPFVAVEAASANAARGSLWQRIRHEENNALIVRYRRVLQQQKGYTPADTFQGKPTLRYLGGPNALALRYRVARAHDFSLGLTAESDAGEQVAWRPGQQLYGADFVSAHFVVYEQGRLKTLALGDYQLSFGQDLQICKTLQLYAQHAALNPLLQNSVLQKPACKSNDFRQNRGHFN